MTHFSAPLRGLFAATFTPLRTDGSLELAKIAPMVDFLVGQKIAGLYVLGSTGEGILLTQQERQQVAEEFVRAAAGRLPVIIQVGSESITAARELAVHAQQIGADSISAVSPLYFKPDSVETLVESMAVIAAGADRLPFFYYHIPALTGVAFDMLRFLELGSQQIPTLRGIKFTSPLVHEYQACVEYEDGKYDILWGSDEMLLSGLSAGGTAAVGSTYNYAAPIYQRLLTAFAEGRLEAARSFQSQAQAMVRAFVPFGPRAAQKAIMAMVGWDCGPPRLPGKPLAAEKFSALREQLEAQSFFAEVDASPV